MGSDSKAGVALITRASGAGTAEEVAAAVLFLSCDDSSFVTCKILDVDGGLAFQPRTSGRNTQHVALGVDRLSKSRRGKGF